MIQAKQALAPPLLSHQRPYRRHDPLPRAIGLLKQIELQIGVRARHEARRSHFVRHASAVLL
ncbi:MAG: hypothetical protein E6I59_16115 [Chloroflexi bacterium]|nr:MAG: hypothetical protein E6J48_05625 [Chloroflexota bacterium]TMD43157.1 MAG: hypothetical protein E6I90_11905 [Chloroflexota bacterium]TME59579.1 MAG: hypothetical protein E6I59_16115 [Chloroflexota bacterium]